MNALKSIESQFPDTKIIDRLSIGEVTVPKYLQDQLEQQIKALAILCEPLTFEIREDAFRVTAHLGGQSVKLVDIARQHECHLEIRKSLTHHICQIPKSAVQDHVSSVLTAAAIEIRLGDLREQKVRVCRDYELAPLARIDLG